MVPPDTSFLALDKCKLQRARQSVMSKSREEGDLKCKDGTTKGIYFDGRKDKTMVSVNSFVKISTCCFIFHRLSLIKDPSTGRYHPRPKKESHTTITSEPDGKYR